MSTRGLQIGYLSSHRELMKFDIIDFNTAHSSLNPFQPLLNKNSKLILICLNLERK